MKITGKTLWVDLAVFHGRQDGASRLLPVSTIPEAAVAEQVTKLDEALGDLLFIQMNQAKFTDARRVDELSWFGAVCADRKLVEARRGGGMGTLA